MLDLLKLLQHYGADDVPEGKWKPMRCPFHPDKQASASVWLDEGAFRCHVCGPLYEAIANHEGIMIEAVKRRAKAIAGGGDESVRGSGQSSPSLLGFKGDIRQRRPYVPPRLRRRRRFGS